ncbi:cation diffusion facilitator family transporter [Luethyella okanaganae]|uniref:Cation diffusion facilitator family transporter n=1 Tax=Luethyella okanaganae TaxID=69372 RepID=A0ABW1VCC5_9MICO
MGHDHNHATATTNRSRLVVAICIIGTFLVVEVTGALLSGSLSLLADSGHMFSDLTGLVIALVATVVAARPATDRQTYGYQRAEVFAALVNGMILIGVAVSVSIEGLRRLFESSDIEVQSIPMLIVAVAGLGANLAALLVLRGGAKQSINLRGAYLEVLGDLLGSVAVIIAAFVIIVTGFQKADAIASLAIAVMIVPRALSLLRDVFRVLSQSVPVDTDVAEIRRHILETDGVVDVHDVHVWAITSGAHVFSAHVVVEPGALVGDGPDCLLDKLSECLAEHFDVEHSTFQLEPAEHAAHEEQSHA